MRPLNLALVVLIILSLCVPDTGLADEMTVLGKARRGEKVLFTLDDRAFFPVIASMQLPEAGSFNRSNIDALRAQGFNMLFTDIDYPWLTTRRHEIESFLAACAEAEFPVIVELQEWDFWHHWLRENPSANMVMSNGDSVMTYPDFANPAAQAEHLRRYQEMAAFMAAYQGAPVIALSIGAYDAYHIPDGETHVDFTVPQHGTFPQTWLPYSSWATTAYIGFLKETGFALQDVGFDRWDAITLPTDFDTTRTPLHWSTWMWFRKDGYVLSWLADTARVVREASSLPVTVTLDLRPVIWDDWATSAHRWAEAFDFIIVYYYGITDSQEITRRLRLLSHTYTFADVPIINLLEFSSTLGAFMSAELYLEASLPYVSGIQFGFSDAAPRHRERLPEFLQMAGDFVSSGRWQETPHPAQAAIMLSPHDPYVYASYEAAAKIMDGAGVSYHVTFSLNDLDGYGLVYFPPNQPLLSRQTGYESAISHLEEAGVIVVEGSTQALRDVLQSFPSDQ